MRDLGDNPERFEFAPENEWYPGELRQMLYGQTAFFATALAFAGF